MFRFPFRGRIDFAAPGNPQFYIIAVKHYNTFVVKPGAQPLHDIYLTFVLSQYINTTSPTNPLVTLYSAYDPTSPDKTVITKDPSKRGIYKPLRFSATSASGGSGYILKTSDIAGSTDEWYLSPNKIVPSHEDAVYLNVKENPTIDKNSVTVSFSTPATEELSINKNLLYAGIPYKILNDQKALFLPKLQYKQEATSETKDVLFGGGGGTNRFYLSYTADITGDADPNFDYFLIPAIHRIIVGGKTTCYTPGSIYYDADKFPQTGSPPEIQNPSGLDAAYLYIKYGTILQGELNDETYYDFNCPTGWISTNNNWTSNHFDGTEISKVDGKVCGFSTLSECKQNYWYNYCTGNAFCSTCMGSCADSSKLCFYDTSSRPPLGTPFECETTPPSPTPGINVWIIVAIIIVVIIIVVVIIYIIYRNRRPPKKKKKYVIDEDIEI